MKDYKDFEPWKFGSHDDTIKDAMRRYAMDDISFEEAKTIFETEFDWGQPMPWPKSY